MSDLLQDLADLCREIEGFPRHLSIHVGGMLITATPLVDVVPLEWATAPGRVVTQYNKDDIEDLHLIKVDLLGLRTLSMIHDALELIEERWSLRPDLDRLSLDDPAIYELLQAADTIGIFQVESRAQSQTLPKMQPRCFDDIVAEVSIIRPGPIQGQMVHPFLRRRQGLEPIEYLHPLLEPMLKETLGVVLYQEQVIKIAMAVAGFAAGEADLFRRAMSGHRSRDAMERIRARFVAGAAERDVSEPIAQEIFNQLAGFAAFGFCKSHAAAFAKLTYDTAHLKVYYPVEFYTAILNNQPMGFYSPSVVVNDAKRHGIRILPVDINRSQSACRPEGRRAIRIGLSYLAGLGPSALDRIAEEREKGEFRSLPDLRRRTRLERPALESLIRGGALDDFGIPRRALLWQLGEIERGRRGGPGRRGGAGAQSARPPTLSSAKPAHVWPSRSAGLPGEPDAGPHGEEIPGGATATQPALARNGPPIEPPELLPPFAERPAVELPPLRPIEMAATDYELLGLSADYHVMEFYRERLRAAGVLTADDLAGLLAGSGEGPPAQPAGPRLVRVAGLAIVRQAPGTAKEHVFLTLEDETGLVNIVLKPAIYARHRNVIRQEPLLIIEGDLQVAIPPGLRWPAGQATLTPPLPVRRLPPPAGAPRTRRTAESPSPRLLRVAAGATPVSPLTPRERPPENVSLPGDLVPERLPIDPRRTLLPNLVTIVARQVWAVPRRYRMPVPPGHDFH